MDKLATRILGGASASILLHGLDPVNTGLVGEAILRLCIYMGLDPFNSHASVTPLSPDPNTRQLRTMTKMQCIEEICTAKINQSNKSGKIDCAFLDADGTYWVISSKIGMITIYDIATLEIVDMLVLFTGKTPFTHEGKVPSPRKCALVRDKIAVRAVADRSHASNRDTADDLTLLDISDLDRLCGLLRSRAPLIFTDIRSAAAYIVGDDRPPLQLRFHQQLIKQKMQQKLTSGATLLLGALPRCGKTYIAAALSPAYERILVLTPRPSETAASWLSVYRNHRDFAKYAVMEWTADTEIPEGPLIVVASTQFMKMAKRTTYRWDIAFLDEHHEGGCTDLSEEMLADHLSPETTRVILTATYHKPAHHLAIPLDRQFFWDIEDASLMRNWPSRDVVSHMQEKHGAFAIAKAKALSGSDLEISAFYQSLPQLVILTNAMQQDLYKSLPSNGSYGFSNRSLFALTQDGTAFQNQKEVSLFLALLTGSEKLKHYKAGDMSIFARIRRVQKMYGHRPGDDFLTALVFLPYGVGQLVNDVKAAFAQQMQTNSVLRNFATLDLSKIPTSSTIPEMVKLAAARARAEGKDGLFLLTGNVGSLGVSIPEADVAFLLHDMESADLVFQQMLRANTEASGKRVGIVVDFNVWRTLSVMNTYADTKEQHSSAERRAYCISKLIPYDPDLYDCKESPVTINKDTLLNKLTEEWKKMMENVGYSISRLAKEPLRLSDEDQRRLNEMAKNLASVGGTELRASDQEALSKGLEVRREPSTEEKVIEEFVKNVNLNDVLSRMMPDLLVLDSGEHDLKSTFATLYANPALRHAINEWLDMMYSHTI
uniref:Helicase ATP-binding domain-containing protein n=1 Tax=viral metagenome TaxID=1070528 RepID=A0A6C0BKK2_9ZZZZ